ncbi:sigma-70 family RNA polymerase sigma factor [Pirellulimonas nuda]|uniref:sigma-70 family RNA polymerase sigma factor n=1 Tax=Pirellulimonas nuda TaxID=2528009 RepID=UPI001E4C820A|nr:sigma-70 family RNA polymerase sigma factor [Pirellulimonas nuda]
MPLVASAAPGAVEACIDRYGGLVWTIARKYLASASDAEDAVQEVFLDLWRKAGSFDERLAGEATFVTVIARRRVIDMLRAGRNRKNCQLPDDLVGEEADAAENHFMVAEQADRIRGFMEDLRSEQRRVLELAILHGMSQSSIAEETGWPLGTVKSHARRGIERLREMLSAAPSAGEVQ